MGGSSPETGGVRLVATSLFLRERICQVAKRRPLSPIGTVFTVVSAHLRIAAMIGGK
jgi:hypothetical protein